MKVVYDENRGEYRVDFCDLEIFVGEYKPKEEVQEEFENEMLLILDDYLHNKDKILSLVYEEIKDFYDNIEYEDLESVLGIPSYSLENECLVYSKHTLDNHSIVVEFGHTFAEPCGVSLQE